MNSFNSYPSIFAFGHRAIRDLLTVPVNVEEKIDGSQFSFGLEEDGTVRIRSKGCEMVPGAPEKMFNKAWDAVSTRVDRLHPGWTYRTEYLAKPKHNVLAYSRAPIDNLIVFDIASDYETYLPYNEKEIECARIGLECVPLLYSGMVNDVQFFRSLLEKESVLGGQKIEGVVVKPIGYTLFGTDKKPLLGKFVSEAFKEIHRAEWKGANPGSKDIVAEIISRVRTPARWQKSLQHLREEGKIEGTPRDIGALVRETQADIMRETSEEIKEWLFAWANKAIQRGVVAGLPEWYKDILMKAQFEHDDSTSDQTTTSADSQEVAN